MKKTGWKELRKRLLALGIAAVMIGNTVDLSVLPVLAQETEDTSMEGGSTEEVANESEPQKEETSNVESNGEETGEVPENTNSEQIAGEDADNEEEITDEAVLDSEQTGADSALVMYEMTDSYEVAAQAGEAALEVTKDGETARKYASFDAWASNGTISGDYTIKLLSDITLTQTLTFVNGTITLNLNGKTLSTGDENTVNVKITSDSNVTITSTGSRGTLTGKAGAGDHYGTVKIESGGSCTIKDDVSVNNSSNRNSRAIYNTGGNLAIEAGAATSAYTGNPSIEIRYGGTAKITGGDFNGGIVVRSSAGDVEISGGTFGYNSSTLGAICNQKGNGTLSEIIKTGYGIKSSDGSYVNLDSKDTIKADVKVVKYPLYFTEQPIIGTTNAQALVGYKNAPELTVQATDGKSTDGITYEWRVKKTLEGAAEATDETIFGADSKIYQIPSRLTVGTYEYYCVASKGNDTATSNHVTFTVTAGYVQTMIDETTAEYLSMQEALAAIDAAVKGADGKTLDITLTLKKDINIHDNNGASIDWTLSSGNAKQINVTLDLNGKRTSTAQNGKSFLDHLQLKFSGANVSCTLKDSVAGGNGTSNNGNLFGIVQVSNNAKLTVESGKYEQINIGSDCEIKAGFYAALNAYGGSRLKITGADTQVTKLYAIHYSENNESTQANRAKIELSGGTYGNISIATKPEVNDLNNQTAGYAIMDMLAADQAYFASGRKVTVPRTQTELSSVRVLSADTEEDLSQAVVKLVLDEKTSYYDSWGNAINYLINDKANVQNSKKLEIILLKDITLTEAIANDQPVTLPEEVVLKSDDGQHYTLAGPSEDKKILMVNSHSRLIIENINLKNGVFYMLASSDLILRDAMLENKDSYMINLNASSGGTYNVYLEEGATVSPAEVFAHSTVNIYYGAETTSFALAKGSDGTLNHWYSLTLPKNVTLPGTEESGVNANCVKENDGNWYGLPKKTITVGNEICTGYQTKDNTPITLKNGTFTMPSAVVTLRGHQTNDSWKCEKCEKIDLAQAYEKGALKVEGLKGRTFDTWPQMLTRVVLMSGDGEEQELVKPVYNTSYGYGSSGVYNGEQAQYYVDYNNYTNAYTYGPEDKEFEADKAPKATITGLNDCFGTVEIYYTIGKGRIAEIRPRIIYGEEGTTPKYYDGSSHMAWTVSFDSFPVRFVPDAVDKEQIPASIFDGTSIEQWKSRYINNYGAIDGDVFKYTLYYSLDEQKSWTDVTVQDLVNVARNGYFVKDAGNYPFYLKMVNSDNCEDFIHEYTAVVQPADLSDASVTVNGKDEDYTAYYTGNAVTPSWTLQYNNGKKSVDLVNDIDYTVSYENNTDPGTATVTYTGKGNYTGTRTENFEIKYAFVPKQTTASADRWYNNRYIIFNYSASNDENSDSKIYTASAEAGAGLSENNYWIYENLQDAVNNENGSPNYYSDLEEGVSNRVIYIRNLSTGYIGAPVHLTLHVDRTAPYWTAANGSKGDYGIQIKNNWWHDFLNKVSFGHFYNDETLVVQIRANDANASVNEVSGVDKYYYYMQEVSNADTAGEFTTLTQSQLNQLSKDGTDPTQGFVAVNADSDGKVTLTLPSDNAEKNYVIYAWAVDKAGNASSYICSEGIVQDTKIPSGVFNPPDKSKGTLKDTEGTFEITGLEEDATMLYFYVREDEFKNKQDYTDFVNAVKTYINENYKEEADSASGQRLPFAVKEDGKWKPNISQSGEACQVTADAQTRPVYIQQLKAGENDLTITGLRSQEACTVWTMTIDRAGNMAYTSSEGMSFTTTKAMPHVTAGPVLTGVYGDTFKDLTLKEGVAEYNGETITGTWEVTDTDTSILQVGTTKTCLVTFTPDASYNGMYEDVVVRVTPTIEKRPITIRVQDTNMTTTYGEELPQIPAGDIAIVVDGNGNSPLVGSDTVTTIAGTLTLVTQAKKGSNAGTYDFTVESSSPNYAVTVEYYGDTSTRKDAGTLIITKAKGEIIEGEGFETFRKTTYGDAPISLFVAGNHSESKLVYEVTDSKNWNEIGMANDQIMVVDSDGNVTGKNAGHAIITVSLPESANYTAAEPVTVQVALYKSSLTLPDIKKNYLHIKETPDTIDIASMLPKDCGEVQMNLATVTDEDFFSIGPVVEDGKISYTVKKGESTTSAAVYVDINTDNYDTLSVTIELYKVDQKPVKPSEEVTLVSNTMTYGEALSSLHFNEVTFSDEERNTVPGTLTWLTPDDKPGTGAQSDEWKFIPDNEEYAECTGNVMIIVNKADPQVASVPEPEELYYSPEAVSNAVLNSGANAGVVNGVDGKVLDGSWSWEEINLIPTVGISSHKIVFTPDDTKNYNTVERTVTLTVKKATPYIAGNPSTAEAYTHGDYLYNQNLTGGKAVYGDGRGGAGDADTLAGTEIKGTFTWKNDAEQLNYLENQNGKTYEFIFAPEDTDGYETVTGSISLTVNKAIYPPRNPAGVIRVSYSCKKVGDVELPQGWEWSSEDKEKELTVGEGLPDVKAEYTEADAGNYEKTRVSLTIIREACDHAQTTIEGVKKATCVEDGTTGTVRCLICGEVVSSGYSIPKDPTNHTSLTTKVIKAATTTEEGLMQYECTACGYKETKTIAKLPGGNHHTGTGSGSSGSKHHHSSSGSSESSAGTTASTTPTLPAAPTETPKTNPSTVKLPGTKTEAQKPADETGVKEPYVAGDTGKSGWDLIKNELQDALKDALQENQDQTDGPATVSVDMNGATIVPGDIFDSIKGQDINVAFDMGDGITWTVNGMDITADQMKDIDLGVTTGADAGQSIPVDVINNVTGERYSMNLSLAYDGEFGFRAVLTVNMDQKNAGLYANLFYYNEDSGELEFICAGEIGTYGNVDLTFSHASDYVVVIDAQPMDVEAADTDASDAADDAQQAGAAAVASGQNSGTMIWIVLLVIAVILAGAGIVLVQKSKKKN